MKFGRKLTDSAHPTFRNYYIAYKDLKEAIKIITGETLPSDDLVGVGSPILELLHRASAEAGIGGITRTPESQFQELLDHELTKINNFSTVHFAALLEEIREIVYRLTHQVEMNETAVPLLREEIVAFDEYIRLNLTGFRKALKKFDKWNKSDSSNWFLQRVVRSDFMLIQIDKLLQGLSLIETIRAKRYEATNACSVDSLRFLTKPQQFKRTKFFVSPDDLVEIETEILEHASPLLAYPLTQTVPRDIPALVERYSMGQSGLTAFSLGDISFAESVVVFDNPELAQYVSRRSKKHYPAVPGGYAKPVYSVRWNQYQNKEGKCCLVRECHPKFDSADAGVFVIEVRQKSMTDLISGKLTVPNFIATESLAENAEMTPFIAGFSDVLKDNVRPVALYNYRRTLFKVASMHLAVDKDIKFVDLRTHEPGTIFSVPAMQFQSILAQRTLTVWQSRSDDALPPFMAQIAGKPGVSEVIGFSKAIHAEAVLHVVTEMDRPVTVGLPHWFVHTVAGTDNKELRFASAAVEEEHLMASPIVSPSGGDSAGKFDVLPMADASSRLLIHDIVSAKEPKQAVPSMASESKRVVPQPSPLLPATTPLMGTELQAPLLDRQGQRRTKSTGQSIFDQIKYILFGSVAPQVAEPVSKIEPKTFLANERTFLNWSYLSFVLAAAAVTLASVDPTAHLEASMLSIAAVVALGWSLNVYRLRVIALRNMKALDTLMVSSNGATIVCLAVAFALFMTWLGRFRQYLNSLS